MDKFSFEKNLDKDFVLHATASIAYPEDRAWSHLSKQYMVYLRCLFLHMMHGTRQPSLVRNTSETSREKLCMYTSLSHFFETPKDTFLSK